MSLSSVTKQAWNVILWLTSYAHKVSVEVPMLNLFFTLVAFAVLAFLTPIPVNYLFFLLILYVAVKFVIDGGKANQATPPNDNVTGV